MTRLEPSIQPAQNQSQAEPVHIRPRTLAEALAQQQPEQELNGYKAKMDGGVRRRALESSLDAIQTGSYGTYIKALCRQVGDHYIDDGQIINDGIGKVVIDFRLHDDGTVSEITVANNTVEAESSANKLLCELVCQRAIKDCGSFGPWPSDMRNQIGRPYEDIEFTFHY